MVLELSLASSSAQIAGLQWTLQYPNADLALVSIADGPVATQAGKNAQCAGSSGSYICVSTGISENNFSDGVVALVTFSVSSNAGAASLPVRLSGVLGATLDGSPVSVASTDGDVVIANSPKLAALACSPQTVTGPATSLCTVQLDVAAPNGGTAVALSSSTTALAVPQSAIVPAAATSAQFTVTALAVTATTSSVLTASLGSQTLSVAITVTAPTQLSFLRCTPTSLSAGRVSTCTLVLTTAAGSDGVLVPLSTSNAGATTPSTVLVKGGTTSSSFGATAGDVTSRTTTIITAGWTGNARTATLTISAPPVFVPIRVNAGGPQYTDPQGLVWAADYGFVGGSKYLTTSAIGGTNTPTLYQTERNGSISYRFSAPNGTYRVRLKFAEISYTAAGKRIFSVRINGLTALTNFDIIKEAGGPRIAIDKDFSASTAQGRLSIDFISVKQKPKISAIEIVQ